MILTRWVVIRELVVEAGDVAADERPTEQALERWFAEARNEYVGLCRGHRVLVAVRRPSCARGRSTWPCACGTSTTTDR